MATRSTRVALLLIAGSLLVVACGAPVGPTVPAARPSGPASPAIERPAPDSPDVEELVVGINDVGYQLFRATAAGTDGDVVLSPLSIGLAFGMLDVGASGLTAATLEELFDLPAEGEARWSGFNTLERSVTEVDGPVVRVANRLFPDDAFVVRAGYDEQLARWFGAGIEPLPLRVDPEGARRSINGWVADRTEQLVPELLADLATDSALVLVNTLYLAADWSQPFPDARTQDGPFFLLDGEPVTVPMMHASGLEVPVVTTDDFAAVELPYSGGELSMLLVVPSAGAYHEVEGRLDGELLDVIDREARSTSVELFLPRFAAESRVDLRELLERDLGVRHLFGVAGLDGIGPGVTLTGASHAARLTVDEQGTVAAAATALDMDGGAPPDELPSVTVRVDRPFLFVVRHRETDAVLFVGREHDPTT